MDMNKEKFKKICDKLEKANENYREYVEQFFTKLWEGQIIKKSTKTLSKNEREKIKQLRHEVDGAREKLHDFLEIK